MTYKRDILMQTPERPRRMTGFRPIRLVSSAGDRSWCRQVAGISSACCISIHDTHSDSVAQWYTVKNCTKANTDSCNVSYVQRDKSCTHLYLYPLSESRRPDGTYTLQIAYISGSSAETGSRLPERSIRLRFLPANCFLLLFHIPLVVPRTEIGHR